MMPKPPWFITHRTAHRVFPKAAAIETDPSLARVPGVILASLLG